tara:strand:+ start:84779 stop:87271 length:2493 start_codon:yes stop_codon:yes gene_type:complete
MKKEYNLDYKKIIPHVIAVAIFIMVSAIYFSPVMSGKVLKMPDIIQYKGMSKESKDFKNTNNGEQTLWTGTSFSGMPTYQTGMQSKTNLVKYIDKFIKLGLPRPMDMVFLYLIGFYILLLTLKIDYRIAIFGAIGYAFSSYFFIIIEAGHTSKALAIGYLPLIIASVLYTYKSKRWFLGAVSTSLFVALQLYSNHYQITYYTAILLLMIGVTQLVKEIRNKTILNFFKRSFALLLAAVLALGTNYTVFSTTMEYSEVSQRGPSELTPKYGEEKDIGMDYDYITQYSYGIDETMTFLIPDFKGGAMKDGNYWGEIKYKKDNNQKVEYWGPAYPTYVGAIIFFLFFLGFIYLKSYHKYWIIASIVITVMLGWGRHLNWFTEFFVNYFPMYDKFRAVTMIMIIAQFSIALFAVMALNKFIKDDNKLLKEKKLKNSFYIIGGITLLFALVPSYFLDFISPTEKDNLLRGQNISDLSNAISSRQDVLQSDAWRSFMFILFAAAFLYMYVKNIITKKYVILLIGTLVILDMWSINKRYLNKDSFVDEFTYNVVKDNEDLKIIENNKNRERVYDFTDSPFSSAMASYFHHSIGGYSAAKIKRYQEIYENYLSRQPIIKSFKDTIIMVPKKDGSMKPKEFLWPTKAQVNVLQMLNCGWIKSTPSFTTSQFMSQFEMPYQPMGNARFVEKISIINNADQEFKEIETFNPLTTAIVDKKFSINQSDFNYDPNSKIKLDIKKYKPNHLIYNIDKPSVFNQLAVFSEVYYEKGWNAYIDGKIVPHFRANYILRAMIVPAGTKKIEFKFEPTSFSNGENIALASSIILLLLLAFVSFKEIKSE